MFRLCPPPEEQRINSGPSSSRTSRRVAHRGGIWPEEFLVRLKGDAVAVYGHEIGFLKLADEIVKFWEGRFAASPDAAGDTLARRGGRKSFNLSPRRPHASLPRAPAKSRPPPLSPRRKHAENSVGEVESGTFNHLNAVRFCRGRFTGYQWQIVKRVGEEQRKNSERRSGNREFRET